MVRTLLLTLRRKTIGGFEQKAGLICLQLYFTLFLTASQGHVYFKNNPTYSHPTYFENLRYLIFHKLIFQCKSLKCKDF